MQFLRAPFKALIFAVPLSAALLATVLGWACDEGEGELSLNEYFERVAEVSRQLDERLEAPRPAVPEGDSEEGAIESIRESLGEFVSIHQNYLDALAAIDPPLKVESAHGQLVSATADLTEAVAVVVERIADAKSAEELQAILQDPFDEDDPDIAGATDRLNEACFGLEEIARENGIPAMLQCEE